MRITTTKAVAIPYVIALILGIVAIGILAYWLINQAGKTTSAGSTTECQAKIFNFCVEWQNKDRTCAVGNIPSGDIEGCDTPTNNVPCRNIGLCGG